MKTARIFSRRKIIFLCTAAAAVFLFSHWIEEKKRAADFVILAREVEEMESASPGEMSVFVRDMRCPRRSIAHNENSRVPAASLLKVPIMAVAFRAVREGKVSLSDPVTMRREDITGGSGIIKKMSLPVTISFGELVKIMITRSDNTATNKIIDILGTGYINKCFCDMGLEATRLHRKMMDFSLRKKGVENYTTAAEISSLLERMSRGTLVDRKASETMIGLLKQQTVNDRLPRYLPEDVVVAHKTGLEKGVVHDAGIVFCGRGSYIICVLTRGISDYDLAKQLIARASLLTYSMYQ